MFVVAPYPAVFDVESITSLFTFDYHIICLISVATEKLYPVVNTVAPVLINV